MKPFTKSYMGSTSGNYLHENRHLCKKLYTNMSKYPVVEKTNFSA